MFNRPKRHKKSSPKKNFSLKKITSGYNLSKILLTLIVLIVITNTFILGRFLIFLEEKIAKSGELNRPANLEVVIIKDKNCSDCYNIDKALENIKNTNVQIEKEEILDFADQKAKTLITEYEIEKIPTLIISGEIQKDPNLEKAWEGIGIIKKEKFIYTTILPPYTETETGKIKGKIKVSYLNAEECEQCHSLQNYIEKLKQSGVVISEVEHLNWTSQEAKELIKKYDIKKIPAFILNQEALIYDNLAKDWDKIGSKETDNTLIARQIPPPYIDTNTGEIKGLITLTKLVDKNCAECFDISQLEKIFSGFNISYKTIEEFDISSAEGKNLVEKYGITKIPTVILDNETKTYGALTNAWSQIGSIEEDGNYIVREFIFLNKEDKYKNLETNEIIQN